MTKKYIVNLSEEERTQLLELTRRGKPSARKVRRAQILLLADEGQTDENISSALHVGLSTVERTRKRLVLEGFPAALNERPRVGGRRKLNAKAEAVLETLAQSQPPKGRKRWTMQLLADRLIELKLVDSISDEAVRKMFKKRGSSRV